MIATLAFALLGAALIVGGWKFRDSAWRDERMLAAALIVLGAWQLAGAPMWADMAMGTFH